MVVGGIISMIQHIHVMLYVSENCDVFFSRFRNAVLNCTVLWVNGLLIYQYGWHDGSVVGWWSCVPTVISLTPSQSTAV